DHARFVESRNDDAGTTHERILPDVGEVLYISQMQLPSFSVITPSYNQASYLERTICSVIGQGYPELEYFVMDGGSTDGTVAILERYAGQLEFVSQTDGGQSAAVNEGFQRSSGEIVGWINSDDYYAEGTLSTVGVYFAEHPNVEWLYGLCPIVDAEGRECRSFITRYKEFLLRHYSYRWLLVENYISQPSVFFRRRLLDRVGSLNPAYHCAM